MLTNQMIGAAHNTGVHTQRTATPAPQTDVPPQNQTAPATDQISTVAVQPNAKADDTETAFADRPPLQTPKRAELQVAVVDSIPDVLPENIYKAKLADSEG